MIGYHVVRLAKFSGREARAKFWPWVAVVIGLTFVIGVIAVAPMMLSTMTRMQQFAHEHPDQATVMSGPGSYQIRIEGNHPELMPDPAPIFAAMEGIAALAIVLLAAAIVRRLHDAGRGGAWGLLPLPFLFFSFARMPAIFAAPQPDMGLFGLLALNSLLFLGAVGVLVLLLAQPGRAKENRYGLPPEG
ncbi:uncharacterized membrane protein YhaH (DUF805 family) [Novosphingobium sp. PhB165]|uniref:DUF805 domain-containing protein n=1 Tax=Novosphingobium sp. PhB165 TaxID=2485105 RepID=UPI0010534062|nr:DUF805 domain-containing protein [Novosphingobium sp. PhB165]TCM22396.1 uncharacterized membrane protein YhaH (DUF805 family) [Novosphingobium sp. PhB165]